MVPGSRSQPLSQLEVLVVDCQATAAAPRGHLLEIGWAQVCTTVTDPHTCLIELLDAGLNFIQLPAFSLDKGGNRFRGKKRLRTTCAFRERLEALLGVDIDSNR